MFIVPSLSIKASNAAATHLPYVTDILPYMQWLNMRKQNEPQEILDKQKWVKKKKKKCMANRKNSGTGDRFGLMHVSELVSNHLIS